METVKYLIKTAGRRGDGDINVIEIPDNYDLTFASVNPAAGRNGGMTEGYCLRIYRNPGKKLIAVFDSVISFRDMSIPLARQIKSEVGHSTWQSDSMGNFKNETDVKVSLALLEENFDPESEPNKW